MKKEVKVWVPVVVKGSFPVFQVDTEKEAREMYRGSALIKGDFMKATLIIDVPEPKIEITRSELLKAIRGEVCNIASPKRIEYRITDKLFGEENER